MFDDISIAAITLLFHCGEEIVTCVLCAQGLLIFFDLIVKLQTSDISIGY